MYTNGNVMGLTTVYGLTMNNIVIRLTFIWTNPAWTFITTICLSGWVLFICIKL